MIYEILIRGSDDGNAYKGAHYIARAGEMPRGIAEAQWPAVCSEINAALFARIDELEASLSTVRAEAYAEAQARIDGLEAALSAAKAELDQLKATATAAAKAVVRVVEDESINPEQTAVTCREIALNVLTPVTQRELAAAIKERELLDERIARLQS